MTPVDKVGSLVLSRRGVEWLKLLVAAVVFAGIAYFFFGPIFRGYTLSEVASRQNDLFPWAATEGPRRSPTLHFDQTDTFYPWQVFISRAMRSGEFPLWNPHSFAGHPFFANGQNGLLYHPKTYLSLITTPTRAHDLFLLAHMFVGGLMMYILLKDLRLSFGAALFGGVAWMINSFMLSWMALEHYVVIEVWLPLSVMLLRRAVRGRSWAAGIGAGLALALMFLGGNLLFVEITFLALGGYVAHLLFRQIKRHRRSKPGLKLSDLASYGGILGVSAAVALGLVAIQLLPTWELVRSIERAPLSYTELVKWKLPFAELVNFFFEPVRTVTTSSGSAEEPYHRMLFLGTPTAILALIGFWRRNSMVVYSRWIGIVTLLVALGTPLTWVAFRFIPGFGHLKPLGRVLFLFHFVAAILAAFGLDWLLKRGPRLARLQLANRGQFIWRTVFTSLVVLVVVVQMSSVGAWVMRFQSDEPLNLYPETPLIRQLLNETESRVFPIFPMFYGSTAMVSGLGNAGGYDSLLPDRISRIWRVVDGATAEGVTRQAPAGAFAPRFTLNSRFYLLPRLAVTHLAAPPMHAVSGCNNQTVEAASWQMSGVQDRSALMPITGDWNGDGVDSFGLYDPLTSTFYLANSFQGDDLFTFQYGEGGKGWLPIAGDWNNSKVDTIGLFDPATSVFHLRNSNTSGAPNNTFEFGPPASGWIPIAGDWNRDGIEDIGLYDSQMSKFHLRLPAKGGFEALVFEFGELEQGWAPIAGDWNGDHVDTVGLHNVEDGIFHLRNINREGMTDLVIGFGPSGKRLLPVSGNWIKDVAVGRGDIVAVYDPATGTFHRCIPSFFGGTKIPRVYAGRDGDLYRIENSLPRAFVIYGCEVVDTADDALYRFTDPGFDPTTAVVLEKDSLRKAGIDCSTAPVDGETRRYGKAEILERSLNNLAVRVEAEQDGWLVINESWDPGWDATLGGNPVPVVSANYMFRAIRVPAGVHEVRLFYQPRAFAIGRTISIATLILTLAGAAVTWTKRRRRSKAGRTEEEAMQRDSHGASRALKRSQ